MSNQLPSHGFAFPEFVDSTMRKSFASCEQKWWYEFVENLGSPRTSIHLHAGGVFARGLEVFRKEFYLHRRSREDALDTARLAMLVEWSDYEPAFSWNGCDFKSLDSLFDALDFYMTQWPPETDPVQPIIQDGKISVEFSAAVPIPNTAHPVTGMPILYTGRFDMLGLYDGVMYVVDEKTTKSLGPTWADQWETRSQFTGYCWLSQQFGYPVGGAIVRGISFLRSGFGSAETITLRPEWRIQQWLEQLTHDVNRMIEVWRRGRPNKNMDEACSSFSGCTYSRLCFSPNPENWKGEFPARVWNPLKSFV